MSAFRKGFRIIEAVTAAGNAGLPFSRIVDQTGIAKATAHRLLNELVDLSALTLDPVTRCYRGGLVLARIGASVMADYDLRTAARPFCRPSTMNPDMSQRWASGTTMQVSTSTRSSQRISRFDFTPRSVNRFRCIAQRWVKCCSVMQTLRRFDDC